MIDYHQCNKWLSSRIRTSQRYRNLKIESGVSCGDVGYQRCIQTAISSRTVIFFPCSGRPEKKKKLDGFRVVRLGKICDRVWFFQDRLQSSCGNDEKVFSSATCSNLKWLHQLVPDTITQVRTALSHPPIHSLIKLKSVSSSITMTNFDESCQSKFLQLETRIGASNL